MVFKDLRSTYIAKATVCLLFAGLFSSCLGSAIDAGSVTGLASQDEKALNPWERSQQKHADSSVTEKGGILKMFSVPLKDGGQADIQFQKLIRSYSAGWSGRFQGAGGHPEGEEKHFYLIVTGATKLPAGRTKEFTWIGPYMRHWTSPYIIPQRLVFAGSDVFIEYAAIFTSPNSACTDVARRKYKGTKEYFKDRKNPLIAFEATYKWPVEYIWEYVTKEAFEHAARTGDVISLDSNWNAAHDVCYAWSEDCFKRCSEEVGGLEMASRRLYDQVPLRVEEAEKTLTGHPEVIHTERGRKALHQVMGALDPKRPATHRDKARRMLALLYRFNVDINAVDSMNRTPLHVAVDLNVEREVVAELIRRGGRILYPPCGFRKTVLGRFPELAKKDLIREVSEAEGWIDDDAFQIWVAGTGRSAEGLQAADERFRAEFDMNSGTKGRLRSDADVKISDVIANPPNACRRKDPATGQEQWLARVAYPGLQDLLKQYHKIKSMPFP